jgi:hypothetical protein
VLQPGRPHKLATELRLDVVTVDGARELGLASLDAFDATGKPAIDVGNRLDQAAQTLRTGLSRWPTRALRRRVDVASMGDRNGLSVAACSRWESLAGSGCASARALLGCGDAVLSRCLS